MKEMWGVVADQARHNGRRGHFEDIVRASTQTPAPRRPRRSQFKSSACVMSPMNGRAFAASDAGVGFATALPKAGLFVIGTRSNASTRW